MVRRGSPLFITPGGIEYGEGGGAGRGSTCTTGELRKPWQRTGGGGCASSFLKIPFPSFIFVLMLDDGHPDVHKP